MHRRGGRCGQTGPVTEPVPPLVPKRPGIGLRTLGLVMPGIRRISAQIEPYTQWWSDSNQQAVSGDGDGRLLVVIGDSTAIGIGASAPDPGVRRAAP